MPGSHPYDKHYPPHESQDTYNCVGCNAPLYKASHKFKSGCGWPAFFDALPGAVTRHVDRSWMGERTEIVCSSCGGHLGHVFKGEGFNTPTNERHCVNGVSINFGTAEPQLNGEQSSSAEASPIVSEVKAANGIATEGQASAGQESSPIISKAKESLGVSNGDDASPKSATSESQASAGPSETSSPIVSKVKEFLGKSNGDDASPTSATSEAQASAGQSETSSPVASKAKESLGLDDEKPAEDKPSL